MAVLYSIRLLHHWRDETRLPSPAEPSARTEGLCAVLQSFTFDFARVSIYLPLFAGDARSRAKKLARKN